MPDSIIVCGVGTISKELIPYLAEKGYNLIVVTQNPQRANKEFGERITAIDWNEIQKNAAIYFKDCHAVINLARPPIGMLAHPTFSMTAFQLAKEKKTFKEEGENTTRIMANLCANHGVPGKTVFLNASAYNHYNSQDVHLVGEAYSDSLNYADKLPLDYLTEVNRAWEQAANPAVIAGIRVVHLGFGLIADQNSTGFSNILALFQMGVGGRIGSGEQQIPMLSMRDALSATLHCIDTPKLSGYINIAAFNVKQKTLALELAKKIAEKPLAKQGWMYFILSYLFFWNHWINNITKPAWLIKFGLGVFGEELLLKSVAIESDKLGRSKFIFQDKNINSAIEYALEKPKDQLVIRSSYGKMGILVNEQVSPDSPKLEEPIQSGILFNSPKNSAPTKQGIDRTCSIF